MQATNARHLHNFKFSAGTVKKVKGTSDINIFNLAQDTESIFISTCNEYYKTLLNIIPFFELSL